MPRGKEYESAADRQRAYRERKARELAEEIIEESVPTATGPRTPSVTLEQYVEQIRREALAYSKSIGESNEATPVPGSREFVVNLRRDRMTRAERYARWRYEGFLSGEVASL